VFCEYEDDRQQEKAQPEIQREYCFGRGTFGCEVDDDDYDGRERQVVDGLCALVAGIESGLLVPVDWRCRSLLQLEVFPS
jgi:hypothetical protein